MADIRIKDLATTATTTASDDFMAVDGATNGTRKLSAATPAFLTSVTTPSLTSPASTALTLGTGTSGAAITVLSADNNVGIGTITPAAKLDILRTGNTGNQIKTVDSDGTTPAIRTYSNADGDGLILNQYFAVGGLPYLRNADFVASMSDISATQMRFFTKNLSSNPAVAMVIDKTGDVTISSTTAASANVGALVLQGGISAGNTGSAASYFGGAVTAVGFYTGTGSSGVAEFKNSVSGSPQTIGLFNTSTTPNSDVAYGFQTSLSRQCNWLLSRSTGLLEFTDGYQTRGTVRASFDMNTGAATFSGTVSITGNVGFYGQAATAKPTGVAVTAAAIHAALVTLNLIAA